jgi:peptidoglycan hydrolase CwlO-like protein
LVIPDTAEAYRDAITRAERPTVRVLRADADKQIDALRGEIKALQAAMEKLSAQLEKIQKQMPERGGDKEPARP